MAFGVFEHQCDVRMPHVEKCLERLLAYFGNFVNNRVLERLADAHQDHFACCVLLADHLRDRGRLACRGVQRNDCRDIHRAVFRENQKGAKA